MAATRQNILQAYRDLYKHALQACQYSKPSRFVIRDRIRNAFRTSPREEFDAIRIQRTVEFLKNAAAYKGIEHKVQKNLCHVWWDRSRQRRGGVYGAYSHWIRSAY